MSGVSFEVAAGAALILRGPNGAGKTTLLRTIAGLQPPLSGHIAGAHETIAYAGHADGLKAIIEMPRHWHRYEGPRQNGTAQGLGSRRQAQGRYAWQSTPNRWL